MQHSFKLFLTISTATVAVIFIVLIVSLLDRGKVEFTDEEKLEAPIIVHSDPLLGDSDPAAVVVYFADFACEGCSDMSMHLRSALKDYPDDVLIAWKDFPNTSLNTESKRAAIAARCAQKQNEFWGYHDILMRHQNDLGDELYLAAAQELGLSEGSFNRCLKKESTIDLVDAGTEQAESLGLPSAPTLYVNGIRHSGAMKEFEVKDLIRNIVDAQ